MNHVQFVGIQNIDLHALTGWIPERCAIRPKEEDFNADGVFERLSTGLDHGRCLITVATGDLSDDQAERTGLVATHAYAVLNMKEVNVSDTFYEWFASFYTDCGVRIVCRA